jgi:hypothetical protein
MMFEVTRQVRTSIFYPRAILMAVLGSLAAACGGAESDSATTLPPPIPDGAQTVEFSYPTSAEMESAGTAPDESPQTPDKGPAAATYWGVEEGEALTLMWEDLMPEGSEEALIREYEAFYAMLEQRYAANTTTLADAADPYAAIAEGSEFDYMPQLGTFDTVTELDGQLVRIPGYVVPFDFNTKFRQREFLFVPYMGACIHSPPPPPNQIIFIRADPPIRVKDIWAPYWIEGTISTEKVENELGDAAYALTMRSIEPYLTP